MVALASLGVILAAAYILWMVQRVLYGEVTQPRNRAPPGPVRARGRDPRSRSSPSPSSWASPARSSRSASSLRSTLVARPTRACAARWPPPAAARRARRHPARGTVDVDARAASTSAPLFPADRGRGQWRRRALLAQAFTPKGRRAPAAALSLAGLGRALAACSSSRPRRRAAAAPCWRGSVAADDFALFFHALILAIGILAVLLSPSYLRRTARRARGVLRASALLDRGDAGPRRPPLELIARLRRPRDHVRRALRAGGAATGDRAESQEAAAQVLRHRRLLVRLPPLRRRAALRRQRAARRWPGSAGPPSGRSRPPRPRPERPPWAPPRARARGRPSSSWASASRWRAVPFHMWAPDVYEGAPTTVTAFMAAGVKAAAFGALLRVFVQALPRLAADWQPAVAVLAIVTMVVGNLGALAQTQRQAHAGLLLRGARRLPPHGARGLAPASQPRPCSSTSWPTPR